MATSSSQSTMLETLVHHIALPPRLPARQESTPDKIAQTLTERLLDASVELRNLATDQTDGQWDCVRRLLVSCKLINAGGRINKISLLNAFQELRGNDLLILHVAEQNAGLLIRRYQHGQAGSVLFEAFESSPLSEEVLAAKNALEWDFPGCAVAIPLSEFNKPSFQDELATFLEKASTESIKRFAARTNKAGSLAFESRDTVNPSLITQMLMTLLEVNGTRVFPPLLRKRVRDDVCWGDGAANPWRRCAFWLVLRIGIHRHLTTTLGGDVGRVHYKFLVCLVLARLIDDSLHQLHPELLDFVKTKLCRRLVKLEVDKDRAAACIKPVYVHLSTILGPLVLKSVESATNHINLVWSNFTRSILRPVPRLPRRADPRHTYLTLPNSGHYIKEVLEHSLHFSKEAQGFPSHKLPRGYDVLSESINEGVNFANRYFQLSRLEREYESSYSPPSSSDSSSASRCMNLANNIETYLKCVSESYDSNPEQKSIMLLTILELWMSMDECATKCFGLLKDYEPGLPPDILDVLQLSYFKDMRRLHNIYTYLQKRHSESKFRMNIFHDPAKGCFAECYFNESHDMQQIHERIEVEAQQERSRKEREWQRLSLEYEQLVVSINQATCLFYTDELQIRIHNDKQCNKCFLQRKANRFKINTHEHPLPADPIQAKAVVFELACPEAFAAYRDATFKIIGSLASPGQQEGLLPRMLLRDYSGLKQHIPTTTCRISLASTTKSFLITHYSSLRFPVGLEDVFFPNGMKLGYYDMELKVWPSRQSEKRTFAHHCNLRIPLTSPFSLFNPPTEDVAATSQGPTSYEVIASQSKCPSGLNVHEFMTFQALLSGKARRWPQILVELGSSNINFSSESTTLLMSVLALQQGPLHSSDPFGAVHRVFRDKSFSKRLMEQLNQRLDAISSNWREANCMETFITFILRVVSLGIEVCDEATQLLEKARSITFNWIAVLRSEIQTTTDPESFERYSRYALLASLLCRRTFTIYVESDGSLEPTLLKCFLECLITLQYYLPSDPSSLPSFVRNALVRDLKMTFQMRYMLRRSLEANPKSLMSSIGSVWPVLLESSLHPSSRIEFSPKPNHWWLEVTTGALPNTKQQTIQFHLLQGYLLVDGETIGRLPEKLRQSLVLTQLFENQSLLASPSNMPGMTYMLPNQIHGHEIHIVSRDGDTIVRARRRDAILELIPHERFMSQNQRSFDLPATLIMNCVHWLDLKSGIIEIRQQPHVWKSKASNWCLNFNTRQAHRRTVTLIDPQSALFHRVAGIFDKFEYPNYLTVFQPRIKSLSVELRRLELSFFVNRRNLLESPQLRCEIDPNQDIGTWYGLDSKIVLKAVTQDPDAIEQRQRSVIVPIGHLMYGLAKPHVRISIENRGTYARFTVNEILGRMDCTAEPRLLYLKAQLHAFTSFVVPDSLTRRTGTEEAFHCLRSGYCQPWMPLSEGPLQILESIARLTPLRQYYPRDLKVMQKISWDLQLTTTIQHDQFRTVVEEIYAKSEQLSAFDLQKIDGPVLRTASDCHLIARSSCRRGIYQKPNANFGGHEVQQDSIYLGRGRPRTSQARMNVLECVQFIKDWPATMHTTSKLAQILQDWTNIGGYKESFDKTLLTDVLEVDLASEWGSLVNFCRNCSSENPYRLMFLLALISFRHNANMDMIRVLIAFGVLVDLKALSPPNWPSYCQFRYRQIPRVEYLMQLIKRCLIPYGQDEELLLQSNVTSKQRRKVGAIQLAYENQQEVESKLLAQHIFKQWPCPEPNLDDFSAPVSLVDITKSLEVISSDWEQLFPNWELSQYISLVQMVLDQHAAEPNATSPNLEVQVQEVFATRRCGWEFPTLLNGLLRKSGPPLKEPTLQSSSKANIAEKEASNSIVSSDLLPSFGSNPVLNGTVKKPLRDGPRRVHLFAEAEELHRIATRFTESKSSVRQQYGIDLVESLCALQNSNAGVKNYELNDGKSLPDDISRAREQVHENFKTLCSAFERDDSCVKWLKHGNLWPSITPVTILESLRSTSVCKFGVGMKESLITYALSITALQRLLRMEDAFQQGQKQRLNEEEENRGHSNWKPANHCDWLLLEIDANFLIRAGQIDVSLATISPSSKSNSVLQMNMGQGKTSCIMPMAASVLADGKSLVKVVVPKPLLLQTAQLLHARLGGLLGREIRHIPFSRKTPTKSDIMKAFWDIHKDIRRSSGVMIALPEHLLSFKLSGLQRISDGRIAEASAMIKIQNWMTRSSRIILDECDYTLAIRTQLIYPSGSQKTVDGHPHRWETAEILLKMVDSHLWNLQKGFPQSIEVIRRSQGGFPVVFFLRKDVEEALLDLLVTDICHNRTSILPGDCKNSDRLAIREFISMARVTPKVSQQVAQLFPDQPASKQTPCLLRGLLVHRILLMTLKKRWNVQYGLHPTRDPIAVPFMAKGTPSDQSEWGHPDVAILFTCLAFYYDGLKIAQLRQSLEHVLKSDDPSQVYDRFCQSTNLPDSLRDWNAINVDDEAQLREIWLHVRYNVTVVDYFLNNFVFPQHAKQFHLKLQASGWDIPHFSPAEESSTGVDTLTTGFSGTNDWKRMLPLTISQHDLPGLTHTNAEVLTYLLQPRSRQYVLAADQRGRRLSELELVTEISKMKIRVLIDAGAQILEMDNISLAKAWLGIFWEATACVFFNQESKPYVIYRQGHQLPLLATPFADDLGDCLVYLDQAHTRGTDLKMPIFARGAVTLGLGQTKDHTVQAAMRLRQLGSTQAVVFFSPPEVHQSILDIRKKKSGDELDSSDVISWLLEQTCSGIEQLQPLYFSQGIDFCRRAQATMDNTNFLADSDQRKTYLQSVQQIEQQSLEQLYGVGTKAKSTAASVSWCPDIGLFMKELNRLRKGFQDSGDAVHGSALQEVEQEREVAYEVEVVRVLQKPVHYRALSFPGLHKDILSFAKTGRLSADSGGYHLAINALQRTSLGRKYGVSSQGTAGKLYVSTEFLRTIDLHNCRAYDNFQRPVNWILWSSVAKTALIIIPEEAEHLLSLLYELEQSPTNILTYAAPVTRKMLHFNNFKYYAVPSLPADWQPPMWLRTELGIFAGRLYFEFSEYNDLCEFLGVESNALDIEEVELDEDMELDGAVDDETVPADEVETAIAVKNTKVFTKNPLMFLQEWLAMRRKGQDFSHTPMGHLCQGKPLLESHPFFAIFENNREGLGHVRMTGRVDTSLDEDIDEDIFDDDAYGDDVGFDETANFDDSQLVEESGSDGS